MLIQNTAGFVVMRHIIFDKYTRVVDRNEHFENKGIAINLYYKRKGCRRFTGYRIADDTLLCLFSGWLKPLEGMTESRPGEFGPSNFEIFDAMDFHIIKHQLGAPFYSQGEPITIPV